MSDDSSNISIEEAIRLQEHNSYEMFRLYRESQAKLSACERERDEALDLLERVAMVYSAAFDKSEMQNTIKDVEAILKRSGWL